MSKTIKFLDENNLTYKITADGLIYVEGNIVINKKEIVRLENLTEVSGSVYVQQGATLTAPALVKSGYVVVQQGATLTAPALVKSGSVYVYQGATLTAPALVTIKHLVYNTEIFGYEVKVFDNIGCVVLSTKTKRENTIRYCRKAEFKDKKLIGEKFYIASDGQHNAHGDTIREATEELLFKSGKRDILEYTHMSLDTIKTPRDWAFIYRIITGACKTGIHIFMDGRALKEQYTLEEIIKHTSNQYGAERFRSVVRGEV